MPSRRRYFELLLVALTASAITMAAPAVAHGVRHALFAHNADKVDGKHAAAATSTASKRRNKVASYGKTGFLPNNALQKAVDANQLDGQDSTAFATRAELAGAVMAFNLAACPAGWTELTASRGRYIVGLPAGGTLAGTSGIALSDLEGRAVGEHDHGATSATTAHSHVPSDAWGFHDPNVSPSGTTRRPLFGFRADDVGNPDVPVVDAAGSHTHIVGNAGDVSGTNAPYIQLLFCEKD
jgi:hypothetical protein